MSDVNNKRREVTPLTGQRLRAGYVAAGLSAVAYSTLGLFAKEGMATGLAVSDLVFWRFLLASGLLLTGLFLRHRPWPSFRRLGLLVLIGAIAYPLTAGLFFEANHHIAVGTATALANTVPIWVALWMMGTRREHLAWPRVSSIAVAVGGAFLLGGVSFPGHHLELSGLLEALLTAVVLAVYYVVGEPLFRHVPTLTATAAMAAGAALSSGIWALAFGQLRWPEGQGWVAVLGLALVATVLAIPLLVWAIGQIGPTRVALLGALEPMLATVAGWVFLGQHLDGIVVLGIGLVSLSLVILRWDRPRNLPPVTEIAR